jgi:hypothetical protein
MHVYVEAYGFLKGPMDMLTLYENKYKQEVQTSLVWNNLGRRKRDDYTDGTVRITIPSQRHLNRRLNYGNIISNMFKF